MNTLTPVFRDKLSRNRAIPLQTLAQKNFRRPPKRAKTFLEAVSGVYGVVFDADFRAEQAAMARDESARSGRAMSVTGVLLPVVTLPNRYVGAPHIGLVAPV